MCRTVQLVVAEEVALCRFGWKCLECCFWLVLRLVEVELPGAVGKHAAVHGDPLVVLVEDLQPAAEPGSFGHRLVSHLHHHRRNLHLHLHR